MSPSTNLNSVKNTHLKLHNLLHVKLFFKGCPVPLAQWFRQGTDCRLTRKRMLENFPVYLRNYTDNLLRYLRSYFNTDLRKNPFTQPIS